MRAFEDFKNLSREHVATWASCGLLLVSIAIGTYLYVENRRLHAELSAANLVHEHDQAAIEEDEAKMLAVKADLKEARNWIAQVGLSLEVRREQKLLSTGLRKIPDSKFVQVNAGYVADFVLKNDTVIVTYENKRSSDVQPNITIDLFDEVGLVTGSASDNWIFEHIAPGDRRTETLQSYTSYGPPLYWKLSYK